MSKNNPRCEVKTTIVTLALWTFEGNCKLDGARIRIAGIDRWEDGRSRNTCSGIDPTLAETRRERWNH